MLYHCHCELRDEIPSLKSIFLTRLLHSDHNDIYCFVIASTARQYLCLDVIASEARQSIKENLFLFYEIASFHSQ